MKQIFIILIAALTVATLNVNSYSFTFDNWKSGMSYDEVYQVAKDRKIKLRPSGYRGNPGKTLLSREYDDILMGEPAEIVLFFTPISKKLCRVYVTWNRSSKIQTITVDRIDLLFDEVKSILTQKYSHGASLNHRVFQNTFMCGELKKGQVNQVMIKKTDFTVNLSKSVPCNWLTVEYKDLKLMRLQDTEAQYKYDGTTKDYKKF